MKAELLTEQICFGALFGGGGTLLTTVDLQHMVNLQANLKSQRAMQTQLLSSTFVIYLMVTTCIPDVNVRAVALIRI